MSFKSFTTFQKLLISVIRDNLCIVHTSLTELFVLPDEPIREMVAKALYCDIALMWNCPILLKLLEQLHIQPTLQQSKWLNHRFHDWQMSRR